MLPELPSLKPEEKDLIAGSIKHFNHVRYELSAFVVMDDHVHVIFAPLDNWQPNRIIASWKTFTANQLLKRFGRQGPVWREEYFDRIIRDDREFAQKAEYIITNPQRSWQEVVEYPWIWHIGMDDGNEGKGGSEE